MDVPRIRYARTADGLNIAYQVVSDGDHDLRGIPGDWRLYAVRG
jgi:hypothetical protein